MPRQSKRKIDNTGIVTIIVAIIGLVGTLGVAYLNYRANLDSVILEKNTPEASQVTFTSTDVITSVPSTSTPELHNSNVLVDARHTPPSDFEKFASISIDGVTFTKSSTNEFSLNNLTPYDILIINFSGYEISPQHRAAVQDFTPNEILAIQNYIKQGGGVFFISTSWVWTTYDKRPIEEFPLNLITSNYGITFSSESAKDCSKDGAKTVITDSLFDELSPIAKDIHIVATSDDAAPSFLIIQSPASKVASCNIASNPVLAISQSGEGKIVAITHSNFVLKNLNDAKYDNYKLLTNILTWLTSD
jgi:uncharacterized membrane protein